MEQRRLGGTGLRVSVLGLGAGPLGDARLDDGEVGALLGAALDAGVTLVDTAPSYGLSEERLGRHLAHRRREYVLSTKCGYGVPGVEDWTGPCIAQGIDLALGRLRTDVLDVVHLHSCPVDVLERPGVVDALEAAVRAGKVRAAAYSGDGAALEHAVASGRFASVQLSLSVLDRANAQAALPAAGARGLGVIAKRPLGNAVWRHDARPQREDEAVYWERWRALGLELGEDPAAVALRFAAFTPGVSACIVGTTRADRLPAHVRALEAGPLPPDVLAYLDARWAAAEGERWPALI